MDDFVNAIPELIATVLNRGRSLHQRTIDTIVINDHEKPTKNTF
jgi:hypothetical protein